MHRRSALFALPVVLGLAGSGIVLWGMEAGADDGAPKRPASETVASPRPMAPSRARSAVVKEVMPSSVRILMTNGGVTARAASGVILANRKTADGNVAYVITNAHVVERDASQKDAKFEVLVDKKGKSSRFAAKVVAEGQVPDMDLALLEVPGLEGEPAHLVEDADLEIGDDVVVVGAPYGRGLSVSSGIVSQLEWDDAGAARAFKTDAPIGYGASGGGIFRVPDGKLLAVVEGYRTAKVSFPMAEKSYSFDVPMPGETFAAPAAKVRDFLRSRGVTALVFPQLAKDDTAATTTALR